MAKRKVALVLSSGGAKGLTQIGVIEALEEQGFEISSIAGSSIGTLVGGIYAMGKLPEFKEWLTALKGKDVFSLMDFTWNLSGVMKGKRVFDKLQTFIPDINIEDLRIPFCAVTTDILHEEEVVFTAGSFFEAVRASVAIPAIFTPVKFQKNILIDGGVLNPVPINHVQRTPNDLLAVVNLNGKKKSNGVENGITKLPGYIPMLQHAYFAMRHQLAKMYIEHYKPDILVDVPRDICGIWDYQKATYLIETGKELASREIEAFLKKSAVNEN